MDRNTKFQTLRPVRLASTTGHVIVLEPGEPRTLPVELHNLALEKGCAPVFADAPAPAATPEPEANPREAKIRDAIEQLISEDDRNKFTATGKPEVYAVRDLAGFEVSAAERDRVYEAILGASEG